MIIGTAAVTKGLMAHFNKAMQEIGPYGMAPYADTYTEVPSTTSQELYGWLGQLPTMREWIGKRVAKGVAGYSYTIVNKKFEATVEADRSEVEDDQINAIVPRVRQLAVVAKEFPHKLISDMVKANPNAYDGIAFFSNATGVRVNDNLGAGTGTSLAQVEADLEAARAAMLSFVDDNGEPMGIQGDTVICPPALELTFKKIIQGTTSASQSNANVLNPFQGLIKRAVVDHRLTDTNDWYLLATSYALRPFIFQNRVAPEFVAKDQPSDQNVYDEDKLSWGVRMRCNVGVGFPQMAYKVVNA